MAKPKLSADVAELLDQLEKGPFDCSGIVTVSRAFGICRELGIEWELLSSLEQARDDLVCAVRTTDPDNRLYPAILAYNNWYLEPEHRIQTDDDCWEYRIKTKRLDDRLSIELSRNSRSEVVPLARAGNVLVQKYGWITDGDFVFEGKTAPAAVSLRDFTSVLFFVLTGEKIEGDRRSRREIGRMLRDAIDSMG